MAWVEPNTEVRVLRDVGLDRGFQHTVYWDNDEDQTTYFKSKTAYTFSPTTYQRTDRGTIRVRETYDHLMTCNYMMFRNLAHGAKWFYAFIDNCEYVNENTTELYYTVDPLQSWQFQYTLRPCFVVREHFETDNIGDSLLDEGMETGDYVCAFKDSILFYPDVTGVEGDYTLLLYYVGNDGGILSWREQQQDYVLLKPADNDLPPQYMAYQLYNNVPSALRLLALPFVEGSASLTDNETMLKKLWQALHTLDSTDSNVVAMLVIPSHMYKFATTPNLQGKVVPLNRAYDKPSSFPKLASAGSGGAYTPKNNKMYQAPYQVITISNNKGDTANYHWEYFEPQTIGGTTYDAVFKLTATILPNALEFIYPHGYKNIADDYEDGLFIPDFIPVVWNEDAYSRWWAQNKNQYNQKMMFAVLDTAIAGAKLAGGLAMTAVGGSAHIGGKEFVQAGQFGNTQVAFGSQSMMEKGMGYTGSAVGGVYKGIQNITGYLAEKKDHKAYPDAVKGQVADNALKLEQEQLNFSIYMYTIGAENARIIDQHFSQYGYLCHQVKIPNRNVRRHWCYTKTENCIVDGDLPMGVNEDIEALYDKGITFWLDPDHIGDYNYYNWNNEVIP